MSSFNESFEKKKDRKRMPAPTRTANNYTPARTHFPEYYDAIAAIREAELHLFLWFWSRRPGRKEMLLEAQQNLDRKRREWARMRSGNTTSI